MDELVELDAGAGGLRRDRVGVGAQPLRPGDGDVQVLTPCREDLLVEQRVARVRAQRPRVQVLVAEGRQDAHDHHVRADLVRLVLRRVERAADPLLQRVEDVALQQLGRDVDLDVELAELGDERVVGDPLEHLGVRHRRVAGVVGEVELDLEADRALLRVEARLAEHPREHVEVALDLVAVALTVLAGELRRGDVLAHAAERTR
jgi:hypothetical protein